MPPSADRRQEDAGTSHSTACLSGPHRCHVSGTVGGGSGDPEDREEEHGSCRSLGPGGQS